MKIRSSLLSLALAACGSTLSHAAIHVEYSAAPGGQFGAAPSGATVVITGDDVAISGTVGGIWRVRTTTPTPHGSARWMPPSSPTTPRC